MQADNPLLRAIAAARAGRELTARDMFLDIVREDPHNEIAWLWLTGLLDDPQDCVQACERVLEINPHNAPARQYLDQLLEHRRNESAAKQDIAEELARTARAAAKLKQPEGSLEAIRDLTRQEYVSADAWRLLAEQASETEEQIGALEKLLELAPGDELARRDLDRLRHARENPLELAALHEEQGNLAEAITMYSLAAQKANSKQQWDQIYARIAALENLQREKITYVKPEISIARLTFGPSLLYAVLLLIEVGINPLAYPEPVLWIGLPGVVLGGFMLALAAVRSHNPLWVMLFKDPAAEASPMARAIMSLGGWAFVLLPYTLLFGSAIFRLVNALPK